MPATRPYRIVFNGAVHFVEATRREGAIAHLAQKLVAEARPATAGEVARHYRTGGTVEIAGEDEKTLFERMSDKARADAAPKEEWPVTSKGEESDDARSA